MVRQVFTSNRVGNDLFLRSHLLHCIWRGRTPFAPKLYLKDFYLLVTEAESDSIALRLAKVGGCGEELVPSHGLISDGVGKHHEIMDIKESVTRVAKHVGGVWVSDV